MSKLHFFFCPWFLDFFKKVHFWWCIFLMSRKHYKNRGFGTSGVKVDKTGTFGRVSVCFGEARKKRTKIPLFWLRASRHAFLRCPWNHYFYSGFRPTHWGGSRGCAWNHCKNSGFGHIHWESDTGGTPKRGQLKNGDMFRGAVPETTVFIVVSGAHTGVVLPRVPETIVKIVVSGTWGDEDKEAEDKEEPNQDKEA